MWAAGTILKNTKYKNMAQKLQIPAQIKASLCKSFSTSQRISQTLAVASESGGEAGWQSSQKRPELRCRPCLRLRQGFASPKSISQSLCSSPLWQARHGRSWKLEPRRRWWRTSAPIWFFWGRVVLEQRRKVERNCSLKQLRPNQFVLFELFGTCEVRRKSWGQSRPF